jgi:hypothetical protein
LFFHSIFFPFSTETIKKMDADDLLLLAINQTTERRWFDWFTRQCLLRMPNNPVYFFPERNAYTREIVDIVVGTDPANTWMLDNDTQNIWERYLIAAAHRLDDVVGPYWHEYDRNSDDDDSDSDDE